MRFRILHWHTHTSILLPSITLLGLLGILVASNYFFGAQHTTAPIESHKKILNMVKALSSQDHMHGTSTAPIQVFVYMDLECPYCAHFHTVGIPKLQQIYGDTIAFTYRHFPLKIHPTAYGDAEASECVALQTGEEGFWKFVDRMFAQNNGHGDISLTERNAIVKSLSIDMIKFSTCLSSHATSKRVLADLTNGAMIGINSTPTIVIRANGDSALVAGDLYDSVLMNIQTLERN